MHGAHAQGHHLIHALRYFTLNLTRGFKVNLLESQKYVHETQLSQVTITW